MKDLVPSWQGSLDVWIAVREEELGPREDPEVIALQDPRRTFACVRVLCH